jgi:hypothetical protein
LIETYDEKTNTLKPPDIFSKEMALKIAIARMEMKSWDRACHRSIERDMAIFVARARRYFKCEVLEKWDEDYIGESIAWTEKCPCGAFAMPIDMEHTCWKCSKCGHIFEIDPVTKKPKPPVTRGCGFHG